MPIYEYKCHDCGGVTEVLARPGEEAPMCQECGSSQLTRQLSTFAVGGKTCSGVGMCERHPEGQPSECPPGRCCGIADR